MINLNVDKRQSKDTIVKGQQIPPLVMLTEYGRPGYSRWPAIKAQGSLTLQNQPTDGQSITIGLKTYTFQAVLTNADGNILIGASIAQTQANLYAAITLTGVPGTQYATATTLNQDVDAIPFASNILVLTAKVGGTAGNSIATTSTLTAPNAFDATTLGTTRAGATQQDADSTFIPHYRSTFNSSNGNQYANREMYYLGDISGSQDRPVNNDKIIGALPAHNYIIPAGGTRKLWVPNHFDRRYKHLRSILMRSMLQRPLWQNGIASPFAETTNNRSFKSLALDSSRFVHFYRQLAGTSGIYAVAGSVASNGTITWGAPVLCTALDQYNTEFDAVLINTDKVLMTYGAGASTFIQTATLSFSGTGITKNADVQVINVNGTQKNLAKIGTDKALLAFQNGAAVNLYVVSVSGTVPAYGTLATIASSNIYWGNLQGNGTDKAQIVYFNAGKVWTAVVTASGTTVTVQTPLTIGYDTNSGYRCNQLYAFGTDKFFYYHPWGQLMPFRGRNRCRLTYLTASGNTSAQITTLEVTGDEYDTNPVFFNPYDANNCVIYRWAANYFVGAKINVNGNVVSLQDVPLRGVGYFDSADNGPGNESPTRMKLFSEFNNFTQVADPVVIGGMTVVLATDNNINGCIAAFVDKPFSFDLYVGDNKIGTFNKTLNLLVEPINIDQDLYLDEFGIKIKSDEAVDMNIAAPVLLLTVE